jgi:hypothetical protein
VCGCPHKDVTVCTIPDIDSKMKAKLTDKVREIQLLQKEADSELAALKSQLEGLEVRTINV